MGIPLSAVLVKRRKLELVVPYFTAVMKSATK